MLAAKRDDAAGISIQGPDALELFCQEVRKCREEDGEESSEEDPEWREWKQEDPEWREYEDEIRRISEFHDECRRKWKEQGKTEAECRKMWPQARDDWRTERKAPDFKAWRRRMEARHVEEDPGWRKRMEARHEARLIKASAEQPVPMQM